MRAVLEDLRKSTEILIAENPVQVAVHRVQSVDNGAGGRTPQPSDLPAFTGRLVASRRYQRVQDEAAVARVAEFALLAPYNADLKDGSNVEDTFTAGGKAYRVTRVIPRKWDGQVYSVHALLEEVS
ncbi:MAG: hypothetical protein WD024_06835 [Bacillota bacterium]